MATIHEVPPRSIQDIPTTDKVVLVMGPTGSGKSTFINYAYRGDGKGIGHNLKPCTSKITLSSVYFEHSQSTVGGSTNQSTIWFADTPGLVGDKGTDTEILGLIAEFIVTARNRGLQLDTILYCHPINNNRITRSSLENLKLLGNLCTNIIIPKVVLVLTMWSLLSSREEGDARQVELECNFWKTLTNRECPFAQFNDTYESAYTIIFDEEEERKGVLNATRLEVKRSISDGSRGSKRPWYKAVFGSKQ